MDALPWLIGAGILFVATRPAQANTAVTPGGLKRDRPGPAATNGSMKPQTAPTKPPYRPEQINIRPPDEAFTRVELPDGDRAVGPSRPIPVGPGTAPGVDPDVPRAFEPRVGPRPTRVRFPDGFERDPVAGVEAVSRRYRPLDLDGLSPAERERAVLSAVVDITNLDVDDVQVAPDRRGLVFVFQEPPARKPSSKVTLYGKWEVPPIPSVGKLVRLGSVLPNAFFQAYRDEHGTDVLQLVVPG